MRNLPVLIAFLIVHLSKSQITVINTGTSEDLLKISKIGNNYMFNGYETYLGKCYGDCNSTIQLTLPSLANSNYGIHINRPDTNTLYLTASSLSNLNLQIYKSCDGGYNWAKKIDTATGAVFEGVTVFFDSINGVCFGNYYTSFITTNGLSTYSLGTWPSYRPVLAEAYGDSTVALVDCSGSCAIGISKDRGKTWLNTNGSGGVMIYDVKFLNADTIFAISGIGQSGCRSFFRSFDGGENYDYKIFCGVPYGAAPPPEILFGLCPKSKSEIYITARGGYTSSGYTGDGIILKTIDLGETWTRFVTPFKKNLYDMKFMNDSTALVCGEGGLLFKWNTKTAIFTGIKENSLNELPVSVYPNPVNDKLNLDFEINVNKVNATLTNVFGQTLRELTFVNSKNEIDFSNLPKGIYFIKLRNESGYKIIKIVKE